MAKNIEIQKIKEQARASYASHVHGENVPVRSGYIQGFVNGYLKCLAYIDILVDTHDCAVRKLQDENEELKIQLENANKEIDM